MELLGCPVTDRTNEKGRNLPQEKNDADQFLERINDFFEQVKATVEQFDCGNPESVLDDTTEPKRRPSARSQKTPVPDQDCRNDNNEADPALNGEEVRQ